MLYVLNIYIFLFVNQTSIKLEESKSHMNGYFTLDTTYSIHMATSNCKKEAGKCSFCLSSHVPTQTHGGHAESPLLKRRKGKLDTAGQ